MMRKLLIAATLCFLVVGVATAQVNRDRTIPVETTAVALMTQVEPESNVNCLGWDKAPPGGSWGGHAAGTFAVVWQKGLEDYPTLAGRMANCNIQGVSGKTPKQIKIYALEGLANDSYCVFASIGAGDLLIGCFNEANVGSEIWNTHTYDLPTNVFAAGQDVKVTILATGNAWPSFTTYGQLAVDNIQIWGE